MMKKADTMNFWTKGLALGCLAALGSLFLGGCADGGNESEGSGELPMAIARLQPTEGNNVTGTVTFIQEPEAMRVIVDIRNLEEGKHGFHVHEYGDCSAPDGTSAGGHFNPTGAAHAGPDAEMRHIGDMGNIVANASGIADNEWLDDHLTFEGPNSIVGKAVIVHAGEDDLTSQPTGAAGARVACGVIQMQ